jgi:hypothetical protein
MQVFYKRISFLLVALCTCCITSLFAQSATVSPYSRYGIGDLQNQNGAQSFSMGQTGNALHNDSLLIPDFINLKNPASYFYDRITTYEAGVLNNNTWLSTEGLNHFNNNTYFGYFAVAFPIGKHFGGSFGLRPMSSVGYNINTTGNIDSIDSKGNVTSIGTTTNQYVGTGGINQIHIGAAYSPCHWLSVGANVNYLFGNLNYTQNVLYDPNLLALNSQETENVNVHGLTYDLGAMLTLGKSRDSAWGILGFTYSAGGSLFANYNLLSVSYVLGSPQTNIDTIQDSSAAGRLKLPPIFGVGFTYIHRDKDNFPNWLVTVDYNMQKWSQYSLLGQTGNLSNSWQAGIGIQYIPHKISKNVFERTHYRAGFSLTQTALDINNTQLQDACVTLGAAFPLTNGLNPYGQLGILNIGMQVGRLGTTTNDLLQEDYLKFLVSFTFNSLWFQKRKYQ